MAMEPPNFFLDPTGRLHVNPGTKLDAVRGHRAVMELGTWRSLPAVGGGWKVQLVPSCFEGQKKVWYGLPMAKDYVYNYV